MVVAAVSAPIAAACGGEILATDDGGTTRGTSSSATASGSATGGSGTTGVAIATSSSSGGVSTSSSGSFGTTSSSGFVSCSNLLVPNAIGYVDDAACSGIVGSFYAYGDGWNTSDMPPGPCETIGMHAMAECSSITSPPPGGPFPPDVMGAMCLTGTAAKVLATDYANIYGIGIGLDFNNQGGMQLPYDAPAHKVTGFSFDLTGVPPGGIRVEFPTTDTNASGFDSYSIVAAGDGHYVADLTTSATDPHKLHPSFTPATGMTEPPFNPANLLAIQFHVATNTTAAIPVTGMCVNNLTPILSP